VLKRCAANRERERQLSALPNVGPYIYDVKISGFIRTSIHTYTHTHTYIYIYTHTHISRHPSSCSRLTLGFRESKCFLRGLETFRGMMWSYVNEQTKQNSGNSMITYLIDGIINFSLQTIGWAVSSAGHKISGLKPVARSVCLAAIFSHTDLIQEGKKTAKCLSPN
jgi:hypothetical protein